jgi:hypothetical protein
MRETTGVRTELVPFAQTHGFLVQEQIPNRYAVLEVVENGQTRAVWQNDSAQWNIIRVSEISANSESLPAFIPAN